MQWSDYTRAAKRTMPPELGVRERLMMAAMGLAGETGETIDAIKKYLFQRHDLDREALVDELGDVTWYLAALLDVLEISLDEVLDANLAKLKKRYPREFDAERSRNRVEKMPAKPGRKAPAPPAKPRTRKAVAR